LQHWTYEVPHGRFEYKEPTKKRRYSVVAVDT
jgi:hypothetical protein